MMETEQKIMVDGIDLCYVFADKEDFPKFHCTYVLNGKERSFEGRVPKVMKNDTAYMKALLTHLLRKEMEAVNL